MNNMENEVKKEPAETNKAAENRPGQVVMKERKSGWGLKIGIGVIVAAVVIAVVSFFAVGGSERQRFEECLSLGERYLEELNYEQAIAYFEEAIEIDPKSEEAYLGLAEANVAMGDYEGAIEALEEGIEQTESETLKEYLEEILAEQEAAQVADEAEEDTEAIAENAEEAEHQESAGEGEKTEEELLAMGEEAPVEEEAEELTEETAESVADEEMVESAEEAAAEAEGPYADEMAAIAEASVGDIVYWGSYEQDNDLENGTEPVEWYVLDKADGEATLLAVYLLDCQQYHEAYEDITWENCTLRSWLNSEFYNTAFSEEEQAAIVNANVVNEDNPYWDAEGGNDTTDKVWLLSLGEIERYFHIDPDVYWNDYWNGNMSWEEYAIYCYGQDNRVCAKLTAYADARGVPSREVPVYSEENAQDDLVSYGYDMSYAIGSGWWWLRSPGYNGRNRAACFIYVGGDGGGVKIYGDTSGYLYGVRPALKVAY